MFPIARPPLTHKQKALAISVAGTADFLQIMFIPFFLPGFIADEIIDLFVAIILTAVCGFKWQFMVAFAVELIPALDLLPTWSAVVLTLPSVPGDVADVRTSGAAPPQAHTGPVHPPINVTAVPIPPIQAPPIQANS